MASVKDPLCRPTHLCVAASRPSRYSGRDPREDPAAYPVSPDRDRLPTADSALQEVEGHVPRLSLRLARGGRGVWLRAGARRDPDRLRDRRENAAPGARDRRARTAGPPAHRASRARRCWHAAMAPFAIMGAAQAIMHGISPATRNRRRRRCNGSPRVCLSYPGWRRKIALAHQRGARGRRVVRHHRQGAGAGPDRARRRCRRPRAR